MATRKRTKKQTLAEFRAWLSGVEELQPDNWAPNADQWKLIRDKIDGITVPKVVPVAATPSPAAVANNAPYAMQAAHIPPPPPPAGGVPTGPVTAPTPGAVAAMPQQAPVNISKAATPNMDTSDGNYDSSFS